MKIYAADFMVKTEEKKDSSVPVPSEAELQELGFTEAAKNVREKIDMARKLRIAFEHFSVVSQKDIEAFDWKLRQDTQTTDVLRGYTTYQSLAFTPIGSYKEVPPGEVLEKVKQAKELKCFDSFEVATIQENQVKVPDPIIFGRINGSTDRWYIAQWDDDVKIEQILAKEQIIN